MINKSCKVCSNGDPAVCAKCPVMVAAAKAGENLENIGRKYYE